MIILPLSIIPCTRPCLVQLFWTMAKCKWTVLNCPIEIGDFWVSIISVASIKPQPHPTFFLPSRSPDHDQNKCFFSSTGWMKYNCGWCGIFCCIESKCWSWQMWWELGIILLVIAEAARGHNANGDNTAKSVATIYLLNCYMVGVWWACILAWGQSAQSCFKFSRTKNTPVCAGPKSWMDTLPLLLRHSVQDSDTLSP